MSVAATHCQATVGFVAQDPRAALRLLADVLALADEAPDVSDDQLRFPHQSPAGRRSSAAHRFPLLAASRTPLSPRHRRGGHACSVDQQMQLLTHRTEDD